MDPEMIMTIVASLIILAIGVYATYTVLAQADTQIAAQAGDGSSARMAINNTTSTSTSVFNIIGIVLIIGAIMTIVGLVYSYVKPGAIGVYAFFTVTSEADSAVVSALGANTSRTREARMAINNSSNTGNSVFNIIGIVLIIGAIMTIVGLVYSYVKPGAY